MSTHKDLPPGSQKWASELDAAMQQIKELTEVVRRLTENAGIDMANPKRGVNPPRDTPSVKSPVGQKLSSLADVGTYNVLEGQVLTWNQQGQKWLPVTPTSGGINWRPATPNEFMYGELSIDGDYETNKVFGQENLVEDPSSTGASYGYVGTSNASAYITAAQRSFGGPTRAHGWVAAHPYYVMIGSAWLADDGSTWDDEVKITVGRGDIYFSTPKALYGDTQQGTITMDTYWFFLPRYATADRPVPLPQYGTAPFKGTMIFDTTLNIPIFGNGTTWVDALGTAV